MDYNATALRQPPDRSIVSPAFIRSKPFENFAFRITDEPDHINVPELDTNFQDEAITSKTAFDYTELTEDQHRQAKSIASLSEKIQETQSPPEVKKYYFFDVKRWIEWLIWGISIVLIACTIGWAVYLHNANQALESYALRYRILRMAHSVSNSSFAQLDSIFETHRSNEAIATLEQRVINYEAAVRRQVELAIQQQLITAEQAELQQQLNL